ncbi:hypothetical protein MCOR29_010581 [Pyricularia oryzae]|uniref:Uncharacterized protein n=1 Tax=Pyricularia grisea TaxID=148305 RepID=A0ABQ8NBR3_PYRGI|nr:hypothetical protein MCOR01_008507 [Pyricularia oryzae]KAI6293623.1 hypothetical protein MCOR33_008998 [Pyricularia grisea]KAI6251859.1 hypothetical protein MCOR19_011509 [Pyricularia oryzae]KAI6267065.1 hypothetical protein MCOR26_009888 [Pyricularia oryzae]KAI6305213.1 hypothetical protein MCOR29_010581 [Pyricularia oryzae]
MEGNFRLRRARVARGVMDLDMEALRKRQEQRLAMKDGSLSARSSPGSGKSTGKSTGKSEGHDSPDTPDFRRPQPPGRPSIGQPLRLLPPSSVPPPAALNPEIPSRPNPSRPEITEPPSRQRPSPPRISTTAFVLPPPVNNAGSPQTSRSPDTPKTTKKSSFSSSTESTTTTSSSYTSISTYASTSTSSPTSTYSTSTYSSSSTSTSKTSIPATSAASTRVETTTSGVAPPPPPPASYKGGSSAATTAATTDRTTMLTMPLPSTYTSQAGSTTLLLAPAPVRTTAPFVSGTMGIPVVTGAEPKPTDVSTTRQPTQTMAPPPPLVPVGTGGSGSGSGSNSGAMAGITVGTIAGVGMFAALIFYFYKKYKRGQFLNTSYVDGSRDGPGGPKQPTIFTTIQERFHTIAAPVSARIGELKEKTLGGGSSSSSSSNNSQARGVAGGAAAGAAVGGVAAGGAAAADVDPKTQSQIINEMFQAAFAAENGMGGDRESAYSSGYPADKAIYFGQQEIPQGTIRESMSKWLRASSINPLQQNPARDSSQSRFTAPSWTRSERSSTASSMLSEGDGVTSGVNSGLFPPGFRPASPLAPPVPPIPQTANMQSRWSESTRAAPDTPTAPPATLGVPNMQSRWSASTRAPPDTPMPPAPNMQSRWSESTRAPPETPSVSHDSLYSMYRRDTQISGATDSVVPEVPEWWRTEQQRASSNALGSDAGSAGLPTPSSRASDARLSLKQPVPELPRGASQDIAARLEDQGRM